MILHQERSPLAGKTFRLKSEPRYENRELHDQLFRVEDWWDHLTGGSWMDAEGNPACLKYAIRSAMVGLPLSDEVLYGKVGPFGHLVHISEIGEEVLDAS